MPENTILSLTLPPQNNDSKYRETNTKTPSLSSKTSWSTIVMKKEGEDEPKDTLKKLQQKVNPPRYDIDVRSIQETKNGEVLLKISEKKLGSAETFLDALKNEAGAEAISSS